MSQASRAARESPRRVLERLQAVLRANDRAAVADLMAADGVIEWPFGVPGTPERVQGREAIRALLTGSAVASLMEFSDLRAEVHETSDRELIIAETELKGSVVATGQPVSLRSVAVIRVRSGKIVSWRDYVNPLAGALATGRLPQLLAALSGGGQE